MSEFGVDELDSIENLCDELQQRLRVRSPLTSVCDLINVLLEEWSKMLPINTSPNIVDSLPRRVEAVTDAKGGQTSH